MKAVETYLYKHDVATHGDQALLDVWRTMLDYIMTRYPNARIVWSCQERQWRYVIFAELL